MNVTKDNKCNECDVELEIWIESMGGNLFEKQQFYCPKCKSGCGYVDTLDIIGRK